MVEEINRQLREHFGIDIASSRPMWRVVFSDEQTEIREVTHSNGFELLTPHYEEVKKYPYIKGKYVLENLVAVPEPQRKELGGKKVSYEPMWTFADQDGNAVPPLFFACKFIIDTVNAAKGKSSLAKYTEDTSLEAQADKVEKLEKELFGNETDTGDALAHNQAIVVPRNYEKG